MGMTGAQVAMGATILDRNQRDLDQMMVHLRVEDLQQLGLNNLHLCSMVATLPHVLHSRVMEEDILRRHLLPVQEGRLDLPHLLLQLGIN